MIDVLEGIKWACDAAGVDFQGIQDPLFSGLLPEVIVRRGVRVINVSFNPITWDERSHIVLRDRIKAQFPKENTVETQPLGAPNMAISHQTMGIGSGLLMGYDGSGLLRKMHSVYSEIENIAKGGYNASQRYKYTQAADVVETVRAALIKVGVYAEINFSFDGDTYTIARKEGPAMAAERVICSIIFHDLDSPATLTASGLGTGADSGDKGVFKAQTGALKKALLAAFLIPETDAKAADPEGDPTVDEAPSFEDIRDNRRSAQQRPPADKETRAFSPEALRAPEPAPKAPALRAATVDAPVSRANQAQAQTPASTVTTQPTVPSSTAASVSIPSTPTDDAQDAVSNTTFPDEKTLEAYRLQFIALGNDLAANGSLKASKGLPINRKLVVFMVKCAGVNDPKEMTNANWQNFFAETTRVKTEYGFEYLADLINTANGIENK